MLLAVDSLGGWGHVALLESRPALPQPEPWAQRHRLGAGTTPEFSKSVHHGLTSLGASMQDLQAVVVCSGPGSFTGLRMGLAFAQGLAYALGVPVFSISRFELAAWHLGRGVFSGAALRSIAFDARLGEVYEAQIAWPHQEPVPRLQGQPRLAALADIAAPGVALIDPLPPPDADDAPDWARLALSFLLACGGPNSSVAAAWRLEHAKQLQPLYVREHVAQTIAERQAQSALQLRPMNTRDLASVMVIERQAYPFPWTSTHFSDSLASGYCAECVIDQGALVGYWVWMQVVDELHLLNFTVAPARQRRGLGAWMMKQLIGRAEGLGMVRLLLEVRPSNAAALGLYRRFGFEQIGRRSGYYPNGPSAREDACVMALPLGAAARGEFGPPAVQPSEGPCT